MFTGIIRYVGKILATEPTSAGKRMKIDLGPLASGLGEGDSVAVSGVCLTACAISGASASFDVIGQTLSATTLGSLRTGSRVNLERSLRAGDALDGHIVQGHVDGLATVRAIRRGQAQHVIELTAGPELMDLMVPRGSVAIDGVSLTLASVDSGSFSVAIIPTTLAQTALADLAAGDKVNIETDVIGKYVRKYIVALREPTAGSSASTTRKSSLTLDKLRDEGFL